MPRIKELKSMLRNNPSDLVEDAVGVTALGVILVVALHIPALI